MTMLTNQGKKKSKNAKAKFDGKCNNCNKQGHKEDQCWTKHPELKPERSRRNEKTKRPKYSLMTTTMSIAMPKQQSLPS